VSLLAAVGRGLRESLTGPKLSGMFCYLAPVGFALTSAELVRTLWVWRWHPRPEAVTAGAPAGGRSLDLRASADPLAVYMFGWLALALGVNLATTEHLIHFQLVIFPPVALMGGLFAARLWCAAARSRSIRAWLLRGAVVLAGVVFATYHGARYLAWMQHATFTFPGSSRALQRIIGDREAVVVGEYAAQVTLETRYRHYYVRPRLFNDSERTLRALGITHLVAHERDLVTAVLWRNAPRLLEGARSIGRLEFYGLPLTVYELRGPPGR
jgi:hypothetical protein